MFVMGVDLAGPGNLADTAVAIFQRDGDRLKLRHCREGAADSEILELAAAYTSVGPLVVGLDAPLSYQPGGGDRPGDRRLRRQVLSAGLPAGSVMPPTLTRMIYLTVRGMGVARILSGLSAPPRIAEVHPGAALVLRGAPLTDVRMMKTDAAARMRLLSWLEGRLLGGLHVVDRPSDHLVAALAAALAAWQWADGCPVWREPAAPPHHPFDYAA